jgi:Zincin-like metallopeptidase
VRGLLAPADTPLYRSRAERFDDLVLQAVSQLEPRWEAELAAIEFAVEEVPEPGSPAAGSDPVSLARTEPAQPGEAGDEPERPARIVLYRRPLLARADGEEELTELVLEVVVEEFARLLGLDPDVVDPGRAAED